MECDCTVMLPGPSLATCGGSTLSVFMLILEQFLRTQCDIEDPCGQITPCTDPLTEYDFIVVGGGTAGSVVASRLSEFLTKTEKMEKLREKARFSKGTVIAMTANSGTFSTHLSVGFRNCVIDNNAPKSKGSRCIFGDRAIPKHNGCWGLAWCRLADLNLVFGQHFN